MGRNNAEDGRGRELQAFGGWSAIGNGFSLEIPKFTMESGMIKNKSRYSEQK
jgi:hypothetical protein